MSRMGAMYDEADGKLVEDNFSWEKNIYKPRTRCRVADEEKKIETIFLYK